jgi:hypothetical protein
VSVVLIFCRVSGTYYLRSGTEVPPVSGTARVPGSGSRFRICPSSRDIGGEKGWAVRIMSGHSSKLDVKLYGKGFYVCTETDWQVSSAFDLPSLCYQPFALRPGLIQPPVLRTSNHSTKILTTRYLPTF